MQLSRSAFLQRLVLAAGASLLLPRCHTPHINKPVPGKLTGAGSDLGHKLRTGNFPAHSRTEKISTLIIGGGVAGLSAARKLKQAGIPFLLIELETETGGNARGGSNPVSAFPWGAHYLPLPHPSLTELTALLQENGTITGFDANGKPLYNELHLSFEPQERLFINSRWQNDLVPHYGLTAETAKQITRFLQQMEVYRKATGSDGKQAFTIPLNRSSADEQYRSLDRLSMQQWMTRQGYTASELLEYVNYCCRDDYGTTLEETSAWAGIHYFASRHAEDEQNEGSVITFPEGNARLANTLREKIGSHIRTRQVAFAVMPGENESLADVWDAGSGLTTRYEARQIILAVPQFVAARLLKGSATRNLAGFSYSPWMVANITAKEFYSNGAVPLSWDNVIHGGRSLGYVNACHQQLQMPGDEFVFTFYLPLSHLPPSEARKEASELTHAQWCELIIAELEQAHPNARSCISNIDVWLWGHAMIRPLPGFVWSESRMRAAESIGNCIHFAHSDLSGISIFEEAFYAGIAAAEKVCANLLPHE
ncbi:MAG: FAD-dependent oxidoreductase [Bacteroidetes bacterium]|nr:FAD-dependent oxidoreductase [Bacteroidota bacterium]